MEKQKQNATKILIDKKEKTTPLLIFDSPHFWHSNPFWNFDRFPVNSDLETSNKRAVFSRHRTKTHIIE